MTPLVVDSSVAVKWVVPEPDSDAAVRLGSLGWPFHAPEFLLVEVGNILWKKVQKRLLTPVEATECHEILRAETVILYPDADLTEAALGIALESGRTVYDSMYVALAVRLSGVLATADERLVNAMQTTKWTSSVRLLTSF